MELIAAMSLLFFVILMLTLTALFSPNEVSPEKVSPGSDTSWEDFLIGHPELFEPSGLPL